MADLQQGQPNNSRPRADQSSHSDMENSNLKPVSETQPPLHVLENQISLLSELNSRVQSLRNATTFLRPPGIPQAIVAGGVLPLSQPLSVKEGFEQLKELAEKVQSEQVQNALKIAKESASKDSHGLSLSSRRRRPQKRAILWTSADRNMLTCHPPI